MPTFPGVWPLTLWGPFRLCLSCSRSFRLSSSRGSCVSFALLLNLCQLPLLPPQLKLHLHTMLPISKLVPHTTQITGASCSVTTRQSWLQRYKVSEQVPALVQCSTGRLSTAAPSVPAPALLPSLAAAAACWFPQAVCTPSPCPRHSPPPAATSTAAIRTSASSVTVVREHAQLESRHTTRHDVCSHSWHSQRKVCS